MEYRSLHFVTNGSPAAKANIPTNRTRDMAVTRSTPFIAGTIPRNIPTTKRTARSPAAAIQDRR